MRYYHLKKMLRLILFTFFLLMLTGCLSQAERHQIVVELENDIIIPNRYIIYYTPDNLIIDGKTNERVWKDVPFTNSFIDIEGIKIPKFNTQVKMLWNERYLFIYAQLEEQHISANLTEHDTVIFYDNDFEVFIDPSDDTYNYIEIEINALGTLWDLKLDKPYRVGGKPDNYFEISGIEIGIDLQGTLNDASDIDEQWAVEIAIPMNVLKETKSKNKMVPLDGEQWRINFSRVEWEQEFIDGKYHRKKENDKYLPEYNWVWSSQKVINMHEPEKWGYVQFTKKPPGEEVEFIEVKYLITRQVAYALFRKVSFGDINYLLDNEILFSQKFKTINLHDQSFECEFIKTHFGFEIHVLNESLNKSFVINENGFLKEL